MKILLVEDDAALLEILGSILQSEGHTVRSCLSAHEALLALEVEPFDLIIADFKMPRTDGLKLLETVKMQRPDLHFILISAFARDDTFEQAMRLGADACLHKPFRLAALRQVMEKVSAA